MDFWTHRIELARLGWHTKVRLDTLPLPEGSDEKMSFGVWAQRGYWSGWISDVNFHCRATLDPKDPEAGKVCLLVIECVREACDRATRMFPDSTPCQAGDGSISSPISIAEHRAETEWSKNRPRQYYPTEKIPEDIEVLRTSPEKSYLRTLLSIGASGLWIEDQINTYFGYSRMPQDCLNRTWGYKVGIVKRQLGDVEVSYAPQTFTSEHIDEISCTSLLSCAGSTVETRFAPFLPGGTLHGKTDNGLPPGEKTREKAQNS